jgi:hypothetical protein
MIHLSLLGWMARRAFLFAAVVALSTIGGGACLSRTCSGIACLEGLVVHLDGDFEPGDTFDVALLEDGAAGSAQFMTCSLSIPASGPSAAQVSCSSPVEHSELGTMIQIRGDHIASLIVVVSSSGTELGRQSFQPEYTTREINGPGCGTCTSAAVHVTMP